jgi:Glycosyl hydrolases family 16
MGDRVGTGVAELPGWSLAWSDEFDGPMGTPVDPATWQLEVGGHGWGNEELQYYTDGENASLDGAGNLAIVVRRADPSMRADRLDGREYTSARLISKDRVAFSYGLVRARIRLPRGRGIWPAFWMLGQDIDQVGWPRCGEIDVMENFGMDPSVVHGTVHGPGYSGAGGITASHDAGVDLADDFHLYSVHWEPGRIRWYIDDRLYSTVAPADLGGRRGSSTTTSTCSSTWPWAAPSRYAPTARQRSGKPCSSTTSASTRRRPADGFQASKLAAGPAMRVQIRNLAERPELRLSPPEPPRFCGVSRSTDADQVTDDCRGSVDGTQPGRRSVCRVWPLWIKGAPAARRGLSVLLEQPARHTVGTNDGCAV